MSGEERRRRKKREEEKKKRKAEYLLKRRSLHDRNRRRRKKDCMIGLPFIVAFQGDPAQNFYCNDIRDGHGNATYELTRKEGHFVRLKRYMKHHIVAISRKVPVYKAD